MPTISVPPPELPHFRVSPTPNPETAPPIRQHTSLSETTGACAAGITAMKKDCKKTVQTVFKKNVRLTVFQARKKSGILSIQRKIPVKSIPVGNRCV